MSTQILEHCFDFQMTGFDGDRPRVAPYLPGGDAEALTCFTSLLGEARPKTSPMLPGLGEDQDLLLYRYDWIFGLSCVNTPDRWWDWQQALRKDSAMCVQFILSTAGTGYAYTEVSGLLHALLPSRNTKSFLEIHSKSIADTLTGVAGATKSVLPVGIGAVLKASAAMSNLVSSGEGEGKNWYLYRFLDMEHRAAAVEWRINKTVLEQYGPLLRGSLTLAFHGSGGADRPISLQMRPMLGFYEDDAICFVRPAEILGDDALTLKIQPEEAP